MRTAYLILAHKNPMQVKRLIEALTTAHSLFFVHIDARVPLAPFSPLQELKNVYFVHRRPIAWGGWNVVAATLELMQRAADHDCDRYHLLSGQDYPIRSNDELDRFFAQDKIFLEYFPLPITNWHGGGLERYQKFHFMDLAQRHPHAARLLGLLSDRLHMVWKRSLSNGLNAFGGSQWWSFTASCVKFILRYCQENKHVTAFFRTTLVPDETFFHTLIMNSPFREHVVNDNKRYILWDREPSPYIFKEADLPSLMSTGRYFARKFDDKVDERILYLLDHYRRAPR